MKITNEGFAVIEGDLLARLIEEYKKINPDATMGKYATQHLKSGQTAIDVGASFGDYTVPFAQIVGPSGIVHAFEPQPASFECLTHNARAYPWIRCHRMALGDKPGILFLNKVKGNIGASCLRDVKSDEWSQEVEVRTLDSFGINNAAFLKVDAEGYDFFVLKGAVETIKASRPAVVFENGLHMLKYGVSNKMVDDFFEGLSYVVHRYPTREDNYDLLATPR